jgi:hypothetical protein
MRLFFDLEVVKLKIETFSLIFLVFHSLDILNVVTNLAYFRTLVEIPHKCECRCEGIGVLVVFKGEVLQRDHTVHYVVIQSFLRTVIEFGYDQGTRLGLFLVPFPVFLRPKQPFHYLD